MSLHLNTIFWFMVNRTSFERIDSSYLEENQQISCYSLVWPGQRSKHDLPHRNQCNGQKKKVKRQNTNKVEPLHMHHIRSKLFSLTLSKPHFLYNSCLENHVTNPNSNEYKITAIVLDIARHRLFKRVGIKKDGIHIRSSLNLSLALIDWCLTSSEQFFSYIQDGNI
jgi:hypothetical protein